MKVILKQDIKKVGKKGEIVEVSDGYGRNYLIAKGFAVPESKGSLEVLRREKEEEAKLEAEREKQANEIKNKLEKMMLNFTVKAGESGRVFGSVSTKQIVESLRKQGIQIDKRKILDTNPIQTLGVTNVKVELHKNIIGTIRVKLIGSEK